MPSLDFFVIGEGPVILFLHGWGQNKEMMMPLANELKRNYKCVFLDMPGFGNSEFNKESNLDEYCKNIHDFLLVKLHLRPEYIVGHSFGGKVAVHYYLKYRNVKKITLLASPILKPKRTFKYYFNLYLYKVMKKLNLRNNLGSKDYKESGKMKSFFVSVVNTHYNKIIKKITIPVLLIYSKEDEKVDFSRANRLSKKLKKARLRVIKGDHFAYLNNKRIVSMEINEFFKENENKREYYL